MGTPTDYSVLLRLRIMILPFVKNISQLLKDLFFSVINHVWHVYIWFLLLIFVVQLIHTLMDVNCQIKDQKDQPMLQFFNSNKYQYIWKTLTSPPHISPGYHFWQAGIRSVISEVRNHFLFSCTVSATALYRAWHCTVSGIVPYWAFCIGARYCILYTPILCIGVGRLGQMTSGG